MHCRKSPEFHEKSFRIKHDDEKLFSRLASKESSKSNSSNSFRVLYYAEVSSAVPFTWETRPGTPKNTFSVDANFNIPPLTPPPSYYTNVNSSKKQCSRSKLLLHTFLRRMKLIKKDVAHLASSPPSLSSPPLSSSSHSSFCDPIITPTYFNRRRRRFLSCGSSFEMEYDRDEVYYSSRLSSGIITDKGERVLQSGASALIVNK